MPTSVLSLPPELISTITNFLPHNDQLNFSVVSKSARLHVLAPLFCHFWLVLKHRGGEEIREAYNALKGAGQEIKYAIKQVA